MAENTKIEWCDHTTNLWWGCSKEHTGCRNCYAESLANRFGDDVWGKDKPRKPIKSAFPDLDRYQKKSNITGKKYKVFVGSMMDIFEESKPLKGNLPPNFETGNIRETLFNFIDSGYFPNLIFLFLTKRPGNIIKMIPSSWEKSSPENVWFGTSVSNQETVKYADHLQNTLHYHNLFLSIEPQVGPIDSIDLGRIDWVIQGGESGPNKRPFRLNWAYWMKDQCEGWGVPYFFKQIDKVQTIPSELNIKQFPQF